MAMECGLFDSTAVERGMGGFPKGNKAQDAAFFARYFSRFVSSGVMGNDEDCFRVVAGTGRTVKVLPGEAFLEGYFCFDDEEAILDLGQAAAECEKSIVLRLNSAVGQIELLVLDEGQLGYFLPRREGEIYDLVLAQVYLSAGYSQVRNDMIEDRRDIPSFCGRVKTLSFGGAQAMGEEKVFSLSGGCTGEAMSDLSEGLAIEVDDLNMDYVSEGILPLEYGGTGAVTAAGARANLGAAAANHTTMASSIVAGALGVGVVATNGVDTAFRLRNISVSETLPSSGVSGSVCLVWGEANRGIYVFMGGSAIKIGGV